MLLIAICLTRNDWEIRTYPDFGLRIMGFLRQGMSVYVGRAADYILKDDAFKSVIKTIRMVMINKTYLSNEISDLAENNCFTSSTGMKSMDIQLHSCREREVLQLIAEGKTSNQIAENLHISPKTVETHRQQVTLKLNIKTVAELTKYAIREGLTTS
jgi:DNA-binding NarL/FixJ family response regulator